MEYKSSYKKADYKLMKAESDDEDKEDDWKEAKEEDDKPKFELKKEIKNK